MTQLTLTESNNILYKKLQDLIADIHSKTLSILAEKQNKTNPTAYKPADIIEPDIIENALHYYKIESGDQKPNNKHSNEGQVIDFEVQE